MNSISHGAAEIVQAREADLPAIRALAAVIWRACYPGIISPGQIEYMLERMYSLENLRREVRDREICYLRLLVGGELTGFAAYGPAEAPAACTVHKLYLHPEYHGRGLGSLLLRRCGKEARRLGAHRLELSVNRNNSKAIAVYRRNGFVIADSVVTDIGGGFVMDDYVMAMELTG